VLTGMAASLHG